MISTYADNKFRAHLNSLIIFVNFNMNKLYSETKEDWAEKYLETYLLLLRNAAGKRAEARERIKKNDDDMDAVMKTFRKYNRIIDYLFDRLDRERKWREYGSA
jgi:hypothetical protein